MRSPISPATSSFCTSFLTSSLTCFATPSEISRYPRSVSLATAAVYQKVVTLEDKLVEKPVTGKSRKN
ncbi:hypothetical protein ACSLOF_26435, partial [Escherichia coli]